MTLIGPTTPQGGAKTTPASSLRITQLSALMGSSHCNRASHYTAALDCRQLSDLSHFISIPASTRYTLCDSQPLPRHGFSGRRHPLRWLLQPITIRTAVDTALAIAQPSIVADSRYHRSKSSSPCRRSCDRSKWASLRRSVRHRVNLARM